MIIYRILIVLILPFVLIRNFYKTIRIKKDLSLAFTQLKETIGIMNPTNKKILKNFNKDEKLIWFHAVSVGETIASKSFVEELLNTYKNYKILFTNTTTNGQERSKAFFQKNDRVLFSFFPFDTASIIKIFIKNFNPAIFITMETELWPNLFSICASKNIPVIVVNARLSEKSFLKYNRFAKTTKQMLDNTSMIIAQNQADAERYFRLGYDNSRTQISGNMKFDLKVDPKQIDIAKKIKNSFFKDKKVLIIASTHEGEEEMLLPTLMRLKENFLGKILFILAPRHPERTDKVYNLCKQNNFSLIKRTDFDTNSNSSNINFDLIDILLVNTLGEMMLFYGTADIAFVGGSLRPIGGHNPIEPAYYGLPIISGPHVFNFAAISEELVKKQILFIAQDMNQFEKIILNIINNEAMKKEIYDSAKKFIDENIGASIRTVEYIEKLFPIN